MVYVCAPWEKKAAERIPSIKLMIVTWFGVTGVFTRSQVINPDILRIMYLSIIGLSEWEITGLSLSLSTSICIVLSLAEFLFRPFLCPLQNQFLSMVNHPHFQSQLCIVKVARVMCLHIPH